MHQQMSPQIEGSKIYDRIKQFMASQETNKLESYLDAGIPPEVQVIVSQQCKRKLQSMSLRGNIDHIVKTVYDLENEWKLRSLAETMDVIGDIPKIAIGTELRSNIETGQFNNTSIDNLINDILKLPNFELVNEGEDEVTNKDSEAQLLREYRNIKSEVVQKCRTLRYTKDQLNRLDQQLEPVNNLKATIESQDVTLSQYFREFKTELDITLKETAESIENAIKCADNNPDLAKTLVQELGLLEDIKISRTIE